MLNRSEENKVYVSYEYLTASNMTFTAAERLKIKLTPRNMKKKNKKNSTCITGIVTLRTNLIIQPVLSSR